MLRELAWDRLNATIATSENRRPRFYEDRRKTLEEIANLIDEAPGAAQHAACVDHIHARCCLPRTVSEPGTRTLNYDQLFITVGVAVPEFHVSRSFDQVFFEALFPSFQWQGIPR